MVCRETQVGRGGAEDKEEVGTSASAAGTARRLPHCPCRQQAQHRALRWPQWVSLWAAGDGGQGAGEVVVVRLLREALSRQAPGEGGEGGGSRWWCGCCGRLVRRKSQRCELHMF